jgi:hypothetical protein
LEKITRGEKDLSDKNGIKIEETVAPVQKPISLSELKKHDHDTGKVVNTLPSKEASEEKKASFKDALSKVAINHKPELEKSAEVKPVEEKKIEPIIVPKMEIPKVEPIIFQPKIEESKKVEPVIVQPKIEPEPEEVKKEADQSNSWKKPKAKREVPEDVLRKILE